MEENVIENKSVPLVSIIGALPLRLEYCPKCGRKLRYKRNKEKRCKCGVNSNPWIVRSAKQALRAFGGESKSGLMSLMSGLVGNDLQDRLIAVRESF